MFRLNHVTLNLNHLTLLQPRLPHHCPNFRTISATWGAESRGRNLQNICVAAIVMRRTQCLLLPTTSLDYRVCRMPQWRGSVYHGTCTGVLGVADDAGSAWICAIRSNIILCTITGQPSLVLPNLCQGRKQSLVLSFDRLLDGNAQR